jgi:hypothetical protein
MNGSNKEEFVSTINIYENLNETYDIYKPNEYWEIKEHLNRKKQLIELTLKKVLSPELEEEPMENLNM